MITDTFAILSGAPERAAALTGLSCTNRWRLAAPNRLEACLALDARKDVNVSAGLARAVLRPGIETVPFGQATATLARAARQRHGRGSHRAELDHGNCTAYALPKQTGEPFLYKGNDVPRTGIQPAPD